MTLAPNQLSKSLIPIYKRISYTYHILYKPTYKNIKKLKIMTSNKTNKKIKGKYNKQKDNTSII